MGNFIHAIILVTTFALPIYAQDHVNNLTCKGQEVSLFDDLLTDNPKKMEGKCYYFFPAKRIKKITLQKQLHIFKSGAVLVNFGTAKAVSFVGDVIVTGTYDYVSETGKKMIIPVVMPTDDILLLDSEPPKDCEANGFDEEMDFAEKVCRVAKNIGFHPKLVHSFGAGGIDVFISKSEADNLRENPEKLKELVISLAEWAKRNYNRSNTVTVTIVEWGNSKIAVGSKFKKEKTKVVLY